MNKYICTKCSKACYSAAELKRLYNDRCPYCNSKIKPEIVNDSEPVVEVHVK